MHKDNKVYIAGHKGLVGSTLVSLLKKKGYNNLTTRSSQELDLRNQDAVSNFFATEKPEYVILAAAKVGGIGANEKYPADFIYDNLSIQNNIIHQSFLHGVKKLLFLGSSCIYPRECLQPIREEYLLSGYLESTNEPYAIAKIAGIKMCQSYNRQYGTNFIAIMPTNLYGPNDNFHPENSHVIPALIRRFHEARENQAKEVIIWGSGIAKREFLHVEDMAEACLFIMNNFDPSSKQNETGAIYLNAGSGEEISIKELVEMIKDISGFKGDIVWDISKPDGTLRKLLDCSKINSLGWQSNISLREGLQESYQEYIDANNKNKE